MKAEYTEVFFETDGTIIEGAQKTVEIPFRRVSARAIIVRKGDGAIIGTVHHQGAKCALPGGNVDDGEHTDTTIIRELEEENFTLIGSDDGWRERIEVSYFHGYQELAVWYLFIVEDADIQPSEENVESRWMQQHEDVWHPLVRERILLAIQNYAPELVK